MELQALREARVALQRQIETMDQQIQRLEEARSLHEKSEQDGSDEPQ